MAEGRNLVSYVSRDCGHRNRPFRFNAWMWRAVRRRGCGVHCLIVGVAAVPGENMSELMQGNVILASWSGLLRGQDVVRADCGDPRPVRSRGTGIGCATSRIGLPRRSPTLRHNSHTSSGGRMSNCLSRFRHLRTSSRSLLIGSPRRSWYPAYSSFHRSACSRRYTTSSRSATCWRPCSDSSPALNAII